MKNRISLLFALCCLHAFVGQAQEKPNVLMIVLDDLNDYVGVLGGHPQAQTPNMDRFAIESVLFTNAHANVPVCQPSRASFMTGISPLRSHMWGFNNWLKNNMLAESTTIPEFFKSQGYTAMQSGKVFHSSKKGAWSVKGIPKDYGPTAYNGKKAVPHPSSPVGMRALGALDATFASLADVPYAPNSSNPGVLSGWYKGSWSKEPFRYVNDNDRDLMTDEKSTIWAAEQFEKMGSQENPDPFFMAIGLQRPHTPLVVPHKYFEMFPIDEIQIPVIRENDKEDTHMEDNSLKKGGKSRGRKAFEGLVNSADPKDLALRKYTQAYLASVAFADDRIGELLTALESSAFNDNTIVVLFSDHGYNLGEKDYLFKYALWEESTRIPLFIKAPKYKQNAGKQVSHPVSLLDIFPTLVSLTNHDESKVISGGKPQLDGHSLEPFLANPNTKKWTGPDGALTVIASWRSQQPSQQHLSVRGKRYRYIRYANGMEEFYDHMKDPYEWFNLAQDQKEKGNLSKMSNILDQQLDKHQKTNQK